MTRRHFITSIQNALHDARVDFAFLHGLDELDRDSDIDIVISRGDLKPVDSLIRTGALGGLVQRVDYDVPWCRSYLLDTRDPNRRFRQLDVACDPFGISRHGQALREPLKGVVVKEGRPVVGSETRLVYLAAKRAWKGIRDQRDLTQLQEAFNETPDGAATLNHTFGYAGRRLAEALTTSFRVDDALGLVGKSIKSHRNHPTRFLLRAVFGTTRIIRRVITPAGLVIAVVGPDGVGKSTLAGELVAETADVFRDVKRLHLTPGILPAPGHLLRRPARDATRPHTAPSGRLGSVLRILYLATDTFVGWGPKVTLPRIRANLVVIERGWRDLEVDPVRYRLVAGKRIIRLLTRLLPKPDLTFVLQAEAQIVYDRKPELTVAEISRQIATWRSIAAKHPKRFIELDTTDAGRVGQQTLDAVIERMAARAGSLEIHSAAFKVLGRPRSGPGTPMTVVSSRGLPRWILPIRKNGAGPLSSRLYRPGSFRTRAGAALLEARSRLGVANSSSLTLDSSTGLLPELQDVLGLSGVELAAMLPTDPRRSMRTVISVLHQGRSVAIAKVDADDSIDLSREFRVLTQLENCLTDALTLPRVLAFFRWQGLQVLVITSLSVRGRTDRSFGHTEERALAELCLLPASLDVDTGIGSGIGSALVHGDFCGWNTSRLKDGGLAVWDWEWVRRGELLEDWFHWHLQRALHFEHGSLSDVVKWALAPPQTLLRFAELVGAPPETAPIALAIALQEGMRRLDSEVGRAYQLRADALAQLMRG